MLSPAKVCNFRAKHGPTSVVPNSNTTSARKHRLTASVQAMQSGPAPIGVEGRHVYSDPGCIDAQIFMIDVTEMIDQERLRAVNPIFRGPRNQREPFAQAGITAVIQRSAGGVRP